MSLPGIHTWNELAVQLAMTPRSTPTRRSAVGRGPSGDVTIEVAPGDALTWGDAALASVALITGTDGADGLGDSTPVSVLTLTMARPSHLAVRVQARRGPPLPPSDLVGARTGKPGDARLDGHYDVSAEDPAQAAALLRELPASALLPAIHATGWLASFDARTVLLHRPVPEIRPESWRIAIEAAEGLAARVAAAAAVLPPATWREVTRAWEPACAPRGLVREHGGDWSGVIDGRTMRVSPGAMGDKRSTRLTSRFATHERAKVGLTPQSGAALVALGTATDHAVGDRDFDARFIVTSDSAEVAKAALPPDLRAQLCALQGRGVSVRSDATGATLEAPALIEEPDAIGRGLDVLIRLCSAVVR